MHPRGRDALAWQTCNTFFQEVAAAMKTLGSRITIELICGGLSEELAKMRFKGDLTRPKEFPRKYTRMWLSNVPCVLSSHIGYGSITDCHPSAAIILMVP